MFYKAARGLKSLIFYSIILISDTAFAHPVSFEDGTMIMSYFSKDWIEHDVNYTFSPSSSFGLTQFRITENSDSRDYLIPRISKRFRKNSLDYQANLYLTHGLGARIDNDNSSLAGLLGIQADYETRRIYTLGLAETIIDNEGEPRTHLQYRIGAAPYKADFNDLSTWLIAQVDYRPYKKEEISFMPVLRFFYKNVLFELGCDFDGNIATTFMLNF